MIAMASRSRRVVRRAVLERERDGDEHHDEIDKREGKLGVQIDEIFRTWTRRLEPAT